MVVHIVMWKLKENMPGPSKSEHSLVIKNALEGLRSKIPSLLSLEVGINGLNADQNWDIVLHTTFKDAEGLLAYAKHPEHLKVAELISAVRETRACVDYEA